MSKKTKASIEIEKFIQTDKELSYVEATLLYMETHDLEFKDIKKVISPALYDKIYNECLDGNLMNIGKRNTASLNEFF